MKILRKITKIDKILKNIQEEQIKNQISEEEEEYLRESDNTKKNTHSTNSLNAKNTTTQNDTTNFDSRINKIKIMTTFRQVWSLLSGMRREIPKLFLFMTINSLFGLFSISLIIPFVLMLQNIQYIASTIDITDFSIYKQFIIQFSRTMYEWLNLSSSGILVLLYGAIFIMMFVLRSLMGVYIEYKISIYGAEATRHFSAKIFSVLLYISYTYYLGRNSARTMYVMGLATKNQGVIVGMFNTINDLLLMLVIGVGVAVWTPNVVFIGLLVFIISLVVYKFSHKELKRLGVIELMIGRKSNQNVYQGIHNFTFSRLYHSEPFFLRVFHSLINVTIPIVAYKKVVAALPRITVEILLTMAFIGYAIYVVIVSPTRVDDIMTTAAMLAAAVLKLMPASLRLTGYLGTLAGDQISVDEFYREYTAALCHTVDDGEHEYSENFSFERKIIVTNINFSYPKFNSSGISYTYDNSLPVVKNLSFTIKKGERIGIIGGSGGGKTTLMNLLMAFLEPSSGNIEVDGIDIHTHMRSWHKIIGYVPQETMLMSGSVLENIAFGLSKDKIDKQKVIKSLKDAHIWHTIESLPNGVYSDIGDAGKRLSGGQRQRLGIARALYRDPQIIFFDEATSHLDQKTEKEVQNAIDEVGGNKTIIIVAHRLHTLEKCDKIFCIDNGNIVFEGSYKQMMRKYGK